LLYRFLSKDFLSRFRQKATRRRNEPPGRRIRGSGGRSGEEEDTSLDPNAKPLTFRDMLACEGDPDP